MGVVEVRLMFDVGAGVVVFWGGVFLIAMMAYLFAVVVYWEGTRW